MVFISFNLIDHPNLNFWKDKEIMSLAFIKGFHHYIPPIVIPKESKI